MSNFIGASGTRNMACTVVSSCLVPTQLTTLVVQNWPFVYTVYTEYLRMSHPTK